MTSGAHTKITARCRSNVQFREVILPYITVLRNPCNVVNGSDVRCPLLLGGVEWDPVCAATAPRRLHRGPSRCTIDHPSTTWLHVGSGADRDIRTTQSSREGHARSSSVAQRSRHDKAGHRGHYNSRLVYMESWTKLSETQ